MEEEVAGVDGEMGRIARAEELQTHFHEFFACDFRAGQGLEDFWAVGGVEVLSLFYA